MAEMLSVEEVLTSVNSFLESAKNFLNADLKDSKTKASIEFAAVDLIQKLDITEKYYKGQIAQITAFGDWQNRSNSRVNVDYYNMYLVWLEDAHKNVKDILNKIQEMQWSSVPVGPQF